MLRFSRPIRHRQECLCYHSTQPMSFHLEPPPGFRGLDPNLPITIYRRNLPHWRQEGATYFVTFRLADALPETCLSDIAAVREGWERTHPEPRTESDWEDYARMISEKEEAWLDRGHGACWFSNKAHATAMENALRKFDGERYHLGAFVIMPNHVHLIARPFRDHQLDGITRGWKGVVARKINQAEGLSGQLWQEESYDRIVRDSEHLLRVIRYIGKNPKGGDSPVWGWEGWADAGYTLTETFQP